ncbi:MAG TPA: Ni/Fe-hydrogenase, b-type cytochrome subunit [Nitrospiria bacterium]|nr:Ni/Fe-hydrogenase, b-type cytochrome subunit [Nitrospiria bacterium]
MKREREYVYVWNLTYRIDHWLRVLALAVLTVTGFYIHWPFGPGGAPGGLAVMAWMRFFHFASAYVFILGLVMRVYLAFNSTFDSDWRDFGILKNIKNIPDVLLYYLFLKDTHKKYRRYNPMQALTYLFWSFLILFMAATGFALYHGKVFGLFQAQPAFAWVNLLLGGESATRIWHFAGMWVFLVTTSIHVYMAAMYAWMYRDHTVRSMISGYKFPVRASRGGAGE